MDLDSKERIKDAFAVKKCSPNYFTHHDYYVNQDIFTAMDLSYYG